MRTDSAKIRWPIFVGLGLVSLSILMLELSLTRIFSVTMWYHFAFVAISVALFGISASGLTVFLLERFFSRERIEQHLTIFSALMALSIIATLIVTLRIPFFTKLTPVGVLFSALSYLSITLPFFLGGICISLLLWHHAGRVSGLYFADLCGAAVGCLATLIALNFFSGPQVVLIAAVFAASASVCFSVMHIRKAALCGAGTVMAGVVVVFLLSLSGLLKSAWIVKHPSGVGQRVEGDILFEKWNSFSRITVYPMEATSDKQANETESSEHTRPAQMLMAIDAAAGTPLIRFDGDPEKVEFLKHDITSLVHYFKDAAKTLVIGPGGGREVLAALLFGQQPIIGVEVNPIIVSAVRNEFGDFTGNIYDRPEVTIYVDEGRSFLSRSEEQFDIIQAAMVDTWAATSSGAFVLTENNLYTIEAFQSYFDRLADDGMLTFSRWYWEFSPGETLRLTALAIESLERMDVSEPRWHILVVKKAFESPTSPNAIATLIVKKSPFTHEELRQAQEVCKRLEFQVVCSPFSAGNPLFTMLFDKAKRQKLYREYPLNIIPPTDDKPFFFHMLRLRDIFANGIEQGITKFNVKAVGVLANLFVAMLGLAFLFLILPLVLFRSAKPRQLLRHWSTILYFVLIGFGFIEVEIPLIQRFTLFLGHPIYSLAVVLSSLLLFSSLGSLFTRKIAAANARTFLRKSLFWLVLALIPYLLFLTQFVHSLVGLSTLLKAALTVVLIAPLGWLMGMPFPVGIKAISEDTRFLIPWCWSLNGAFSVLASVTSIVIAMNFGFFAAMAGGWAAYVMVLLVVLLFKA
ncbi:MAG: hypothetical protein C4532_04770 [Candidatus Abyssobacteria bacterium SURF_17]|uniref:SAM-dependent methyltransferase n=1 Tax=Candidatus Abyssobacteria bacterium SURF_17 TaxID=2093361 RepID=A0A419F4D0_9BACT|nr:MAG: hypothetical protein C4532_04770 [Candidatus Abyssubacteria bacterium SURF_17]